VAVQFSQKATGSASITATGGTPGLASAPSESASGFASSVSLGGQSCSGSASGALHYTDTGGEDGMGEQTTQQGSGSASVSVSAVKKGYITGAVRTPTGPFPGTVDIYCPMAADDATGTTARADGWTASGVQQAWDASGVT
jgi:hypothetical protein